MTKDEILLYEAHIRNQFQESGKPCVCTEWSSEELMLPSHDGIRLKTIIFRPYSAASVPAVISRTCYPEHDGVYRIRAEEYCKRGIAFIFQYCRGVGGSEGEWEPNVNERDDGKALLDWVEEQNWISCAGYVGHSYLAMTGWVLADIVPPKLKTMYLTCYGAFRHTSAYKDGLFRHDVLTGWAMANAGFTVTADYIDSCCHRPHIEVDEKLWGKRIDWYREWITAPDRTDPYWQKGFWKLLLDIPSKVNIPLFIGEGWYDHHLGSAIETFKALPDETKAHSTFMVGAWNHGFMPACADVRGKYFDSNDEVRALDWFYSILVDNDLPPSRIKMYIIGDDSWYSSDVYPEAFGCEKHLYLGVAGVDGINALNEVVGDAGLVQFRYDPSNPTMTHGAESCLFSRERQGSLLQPDLNSRADVVSFLSAPFEDSCTLLGALKASLVVSSDVDDTAFVVKFMEVRPDGKAYNIRTAVTTLGYRNGADGRVMYTPGEKVRITFDAWDVAWKIQKGSRLRIDVTSSDFPQYSVHSNYSGCWSEQAEIRTAEQTVYFGKTDDSCVILPVLESKQ